MIDWIGNHLRSVRNGLKSDRPMDVGKAITKAFLAIVIALALLPQFTSDGGWQLRGWALVTSPSNEIGDTFAGIAGVLAFLWIIITVWLQSQELAAQREELKLARIESAKMAEQLTAQTSILQQDKLQRDQEKQAELIEAKLDEIKKLIENLQSVEWKFEALERTARRIDYLTVGNQPDSRPAEKVIRFLPLIDPLWNTDGSQGLHGQHKNVSGNLERLLEASSTYGFEETPVREDFQQLREKLSGVLNAMEKVSEGERIYLRMLQLDDLVCVLDQAFEADIWEAAQ